jgi:RNA polymerase primary sigma factor
MKTARYQIVRFKTVKLTTSGTGLRQSGFPRQHRNLSRPDPAGVTKTPTRPAAVTNGASSAVPLNGDAWQMYLREISQVTLLTKQEEKALARQIKRGDQHAREQMIKANLRLVVKIASDYGGMGLPLLDLVNEGNIGLMKGVDRFDPKKGKLSVYAAWWIRQAMKRALFYKSKTIRLPVHVVERLADIRSADAKLHKALDREPTDEEIADDIKIDERRVRHYREVSRTLVSLDLPSRDGDLTPVLDSVADPNAATPFEYLASDSDIGFLRAALPSLNARENKIIALRFGLDGGEPKTLKESSKLFGLTKERVRQIQEEALEKLRRVMRKRDQLVCEGCRPL